MSTEPYIVREIMPLKQKSLLLTVIGLLVLGAGLYFKFSNAAPRASASAKIRIQSIATPAGESLLLTQAKGITQQTTMEELLKRLGIYHSSQEENQKEILEIQRHIQVIHEGNSEIFTIQVKHPDFLWAKNVANQLAQSFQFVERNQERVNAENDERDLERQIEATRTEKDQLEFLIKSLEIRNQPTPIDLQLRGKLEEREAQYQQLSGTYTDKHPDMIELKKQIESLKLQIQDGPQPKIEELATAQKNFRAAEQKIASLQKTLEDTSLEKEKLSGRVEIMELSSARQTLRKSPITPVRLAILGGILLLVVLVILTQP